MSEGRPRGSDEERVESIAERFLDQLQADECPDPAALLAAHPELSGELSRRLLLMERIHHAARPPTSAGENAPFRALGAGRKGAWPDRDDDIPREIGRFEVEALLGQGTFGAVYRARDPELGRTVAIKVPRAAFFGSKEEEERFLREARSASRLKHPGLVRVYEIGHEGGLPFIVSDYIEGQTLADKLAEGPLGFREAAELTAQIADALDFAHGEKVVHRDVKPGNILIDGQGQPHVMDFGLARCQEGEATMTLEGQVLGTPAYMSPEQAAGEQEKVDARSDIYSLGVVLYELLTGGPPFQGSKSMLVYQVLHVEPRSPRSMNPRIPRDLETICLKAMEKESTKRYGKAREVGCDLRRFLRGEPIRARPVGPLEKLWRWSRRNRILAGLTVAVSLLLFSLSVGSVVAAMWYEKQSGEFQRIAESEKSAHLETTRQLARLNVSTGIKLFDEGDFFASLPYLARALELDRGNEGCEKVHRLRLASVLARCPRIIQIWFHGGKVYDAEFSPDGRFVVTASEDGMARVWDVKTGKAAAPPLEHSGAVFRAEFSPDSSKVVTACSDGKARIWDWANGKILVPPLRHGNWVGRAAFSSDGHLVITASSDATAAVWRAATGERICVLRHSNGVIHAALSTDSQRVITASYDHTAVIWEAMTGRRLQTLAHKGRVNHAAFSPDGKLAVTACEYGSTQIWDVATGKPVLSLQQRQGAMFASFSPDGRRVITVTPFAGACIWDVMTGKALTQPLGDAYLQHCAAFSPDGRRVVTASGGGAAVVWDATSGEQRAPSLQHGHPVRSAVFGPTGRLVLTASDDGTVRLWDTARCQPRLRPLEHAHYLQRARFSPDGGRVLTADLGGMARVWSAVGSEAATPWLVHQESVWDAEFSPDGKRVVTASWDEKVRVWDARSGKELLKLELASDPWRMRLSPDGRLLVTAEKDGTVQVWNAGTGEPAALKIKHQGEVRSVAFSSDGRLLATGGCDKVAKVWVVASGKPFGRPMKHADFVNQVAFSLDDRQLLTACQDGKARLWDVRSGHCVRELAGHGVATKCAVFSPDGRRVLTASSDGTALVWNVETGEKTSSRMTHKGAIQFAAFSPDGSLLATVSSDGTARVWDTATGGAITPPLRHSAEVRDVDFSPDGRRLVTAGADGKAKLWDLPVEERPVDDVILLARLLSGRKIDKNGSLEFLESDELRRLWENLRSRYPREFAPSPEEVLSWHSSQWRRCERDSDWRGMVRHLDRIIAHVSARRELFNARALAYRKLGRWGKAAMDGARALQLWVKESAGKVKVGSQSR